MTSKRPTACYAAPMIERTDDGPVTTLRLAHGKASALDLELLEAIPPALEPEEGERSAAREPRDSGGIWRAGFL